MRITLFALLALLVTAVVAVFALQSSPEWETGPVARTPDERFANLPDYPFAPHYAAVSGYRVHYLDEGPRDGQPILLLHGQPSWSYLYRHMIPPLAAAGYRVVVPDLVGFGKSDKPTRQSDYTYQMHVDVMTDLTGENAERWRRWGSCFTSEYSYMPGGSVRVSLQSRYRQSLTH